LKSRGREQAREAGRKIGKEFLQGALIFASPYRRTRETFQEMLNGVGMTPEEKKGLSYYEDPRLRFAFSNPSIGFQSHPSFSFSHLLFLFSCSFLVLSFF